MDRRRLLAATGLLVALYLAIVPFLGPYHANFRDSGDAFAANMQAGPAPHFFEKTVHRRPGLLSIADGYFTFRLIGLVRAPYIPLARCVLDARTPQVRFDPACPAHRTSFWSQLYARFHYLQYERWPETWTTNDPRIIRTGQALMLAGLVPLIVLVLGCAIELKALVQGLLREGPVWFARDRRWVLLALFGGSLFIVVALEYALRDFSSVKVIYVFPALAAAAGLYLSGLEFLRTQLARRRGALTAIWGLHAVLIALYVLDVQWLVHQLRVAAST